MVDCRIQNKVATTPKAFFCGRSGVVDILVHVQSSVLGGFNEAGSGGKASSHFYLATTRAKMTREWNPL